MALDPQFVRLPDEAYISAEDGLPENLGYVDIRHLGTRAYFSAMWKHELALLAFAGDLASEEAQVRFEDDECWAMGFDALIGSTVISLALAGAVPLSSCAGGAGHAERHPVVAFWSDEAHIGPILEAARASGVEVSGVLGDPPSLMVWHADDVLRLREFARCLAEPSAVRAR